MGALAEIEHRSDGGFERGEGHRQSLTRSHAHTLVSASQVRWVAAWGALILAITVAPYVVWLLWGHPDLERVGTFWFHRDFSQYLAAMREGARSASWLVHNHFTAEPHQPILMYPLYVGIGKLAALLGTDVLSVYYLVELLSRAALVVALYQFGALFLHERRARQLAFLLSTFSLGLVGWLVPARLLLQLIGAAELLDRLPASINVYLEISSFGVFFSAPHLMLGLTLTLLIPRAYLAIVRYGATPKRLAVLSAALVALALVHGFNLPVVLSVLGGHALVETWRERRPLSHLAAVLVAGLASAPLALYQVAVFQLDPFWSLTYGAQNLMPSPHPLSLPVDFGLVLLLAPLGVWLTIRASRFEAGDSNRGLNPGSNLEARISNSAFWLLVLWCAVTLAWMYAPVPFQRRFGFGLQPGLAALAALGVLWLQVQLRKRPRARRWLNYGLLMLALKTTVLVYVALLASAASNQPTPVYAWTKAEAQAAAWLADHSGPEDVVLAATEAANTMVGVIPGRVVFGHIVATYRAPEKEALIKRFFSAEATAEERERLLRESEATFVFHGPSERARGAPSLEGLASLERVYTREGVAIYRVRAP